MLNDKQNYYIIIIGENKARFIASLTASFQVLDIELDNVTNIRDEVHFSM